MGRAKAGWKANATLPARLLWGVGWCVVVLGMGAAGAAAGGLAGWLIDPDPIDELEWYDPPQMTVLLDRRGESFARLFEEQRAVLPIREIPLPLVEAFLAIEDRSYHHHIGIDPRGLARAMWVNLRRGRMAQGASTITQQAPRNLLPTVGRERTLERKAREALVALRMERLYSKDQILEVYLNQIYLGAGTYGVEAAAQRYFGKSARQLDRAEMALLAGLPQAPERYSPANDPEAARRRRDQVLDRLAVLNWIAGDEHAAARAKPVAIAGHAGGAPGWAADFVDAVRRDLAASSDFDLRRDALRVRTTMDARLQRAAMDALDRVLDEQQKAWLAARPARWADARLDPAPPAPGQVRMARVVRAFPQSITAELPGGWRADLPIPSGARSFFDGLRPGDGVDVLVEGLDRPRRLWRGRLLPEAPLQGALVCLDRRTGDVLALAGGRRLDDAGAVDHFNRALDARRQVGSTLKPFVYAAALERGASPWDELLDEPIQFPNGYSPRNYDGRFRGPTTMQAALEDSRNVPTVRLAQAVGLRRVLDTVRRFDRAPGGRGWDLPMEYAAVLGLVEATPFELAVAYQALANSGSASGPRVVQAVQGAAPRPAPPDRLLGPRASAYTHQLMLGAMTHGTGRGVRARLPERLRDAAAGKTGTTNDNRDAWFAGYTPDLVAVAWVGFDRWLPLAPGQTGASAAGPLWAEFISEAAQGSNAPARLPLPDGWRWELLDIRTGRPSAADSAGGAAAWRAVPRG